MGIYICFSAFIPVKHSSFHTFITSLIVLINIMVGAMSGALFYLKIDFPVVDHDIILQEVIVSAAVAGAIVGAVTGVWLNDKCGRRTSILVANFLYFVGAIISASALNVAMLMVGRVFVGLGVGLSSLTAPLYISEASPVKFRGVLVSANVFLVTAWQFVCTLLNIAFTKVPYSWRWMLGVAGLPALLQFGLMLMLPESPHWLYRKGKEAEAEALLAKIYPADEVGIEVQALQESRRKENEEQQSAKYLHLMTLLKNKCVRRGLVAGVGLQFFQQIVGINTVVDYGPTVLQLAGYASIHTALLLSIVTAGLNAVGSIVSICLIDRTGRKKLLIISLFGVIISLVFLSVVFHEAALHSPPLSSAETSPFSNFTCPDYRTAGTSAVWDCTQCLEVTHCGFCGSSDNYMVPGSCVISSEPVVLMCEGEHKQWYTMGCPSKVGWMAVIALALYVISFSPGMGTVVWVVNSEVYPLRFRGECLGIAATVNWISNLVVSQSFLSLTRAVGPAYTFGIYCVISVLAVIFVLVYVPETKGDVIEEIEKLLEENNERTSEIEAGEVG